MKTIDYVDLSGKNVLIRLDLDVPLAGGRIADDSRLAYGLATLRELAQKGAKQIWVAGHLGRPRGHPATGLSLKPVEEWLRERIPGVRVLENLRFEPGEEGNEEAFARHLVQITRSQAYVFDAFAVSHRSHASVVQLPKLLPTVIGRRFEAEVSALSRLHAFPVQPVVVVLGGAKVETKLPYVSHMAQIAHQVLLGGILPQSLVTAGIPNGRCVTTAVLTGDGMDISPESAGQFAEIIRRAGTVVWNGPMGKYESGAGIQNPAELRQTSAWGTYVVARAMQDTPAYTVIGGGDTEAAVNMFRTRGGIDWMSSGGGAMLHFLAHRTLPLLTALEQSPSL